MPDLSLRAQFKLTPQEAVDYLAGRGKLTPTFGWSDLQRDEHAQQFTVSRLARLDLLKAVQEGIGASVNGDLSRRDFMRDIQVVLEKEGWWGKKAVRDPVTGETVTTNFDPARLKLIYDTNTRMAHSAGRWERFERNKASHPYLRYITKRDERVRASHADWDGVTLPVDHAFWDAHYPPNGWRCRCRAMSMSQREYDAAQGKGWLKTEAPPVETKPWVNKRTGEARQVPVGIDPGFDYNVGKAAMRARNLEAVVKDKLASAPAALAAAAKQAGMAPAATIAVMPTLPKPERTPWRDFPDVSIHAPETAVKKHSDYAAAKAGDVAAAVRLVQASLDDAAVARLRDLVGAAEPRLVGVHAVEGQSVNVIPVAMAAMLSERLSWSVETGIIQINRVGHTGSGGFHRLATPALFAGDVIRGAEYVLVDDFIGQGGTLANLRGHIESGGGRVLAATALTGKPYSAILKATPETLAKLREKHGQFEDWWRQRYGYGFELLTESEARYLERSPDADAIRAGLFAATSGEGAR